MQIDAAAPRSLSPIMCRLPAYIRVGRATALAWEMRRSEYDGVHIHRQPVPPKALTGESPVRLPTEREVNRAVPTGTLLPDLPLACVACSEEDGVPDGSGGRQRRHWRQRHGCGCDRGRERRVHSSDLRVRVLATGIPELVAVMKPVREHGLGSTNSGSSST
jgi:hypothetical protein